MKVFIDSGGFASTFNRKDQHYEAALPIWRRLQQLRLPLFTSNYVLSETITLLRLRSGHAAAAEFGQTILQTKMVETIYVTRDLDAQALAIFTKFHDQEFSFVDCSSFAIMRNLGIQRAFAFDHHFTIAGFERLS